MRIGNGAQEEIKKVHYNKKWCIRKQVKTTNL